ncbi:ATP-binding cassette domain-containing protein [Mycobacterium sp. IS-2888]|uniref:ABC transporter ATP-binding protein n=1 Tax=Mycobacterium sp. IS-2888 TaxID=1834159 RepID=UPI00352BAAB4
MDSFVLERVSVVRDKATVLRQVSAHFPGGRCIAVRGASGSGKTTLLRLLNRLIDPTAGRVLLDGVPLIELDVLALRRRVGLVAQAPVLLTEAVLDEVRVGRPDLPEGRVTGLLGRVGLGEKFVTRPTSGLSGGEAQRLCLARSLAVEPEVLLLDEPTSALDGPSAAVIATLVRDHVNAGGTVVLASHDAALVGDVAGRIFELDRGRLTAGRGTGDTDHTSPR